MDTLGQCLSQTPGEMSGSPGSEVCGSCKPLGAVQAECDYVSKTHECNGVLVVAADHGEHLWLTAPRSRVSVRLYERANSL
jgi:hypothetical protein